MHRAAAQSVSSEAEPRSRESEDEAAPGPTFTGCVKVLGEVEKEYILAVLHRNANNQARTAEALGIGTATSTERSINTAYYDRIEAQERPIAYNPNRQVK